MADLSEEKLTLSADLDFASIKAVTLYQEWQLLKEFEKTDKALHEKYAGKKAEKTEINVKVQECFAKLNMKRSQIEQIIQKEADIFEEVKNAIGENNKNEAYLLKVFKKKIKRTKKKVNEDGEIVDDSEDEESDSESDSYDEDQEDQDKEINLPDVCPVDCEESLWQSILSFREQRLDAEDEIAEIQKFTDVRFLLLTVLLLTA